MSQTPAIFVWHELMTSDPAAATAFDQQVVGWVATPGAMPEQNYTLLEASGTQVAGLMPLPPAAAAGGARPCWMGYLAVPDVDAKVATLQAAGGALHHPPADIPGVGRFATVADPHGAVVCLFKSSGSDEPPVSTPGAPGTFAWNELMADDLDSAWAFYSGLLGWAKDAAVDMGPMGTYPLMEVPGGSWVINCLDPQGARFSLVAPRHWVDATQVGRRGPRRCLHAAPVLPAHLEQRAGDLAQAAAAHRVHQHVKHVVVGDYRLLQALQHGR